MRLARRKFLALSAGAASTATLGLFSRGAAGAQTVVKIGVINSLSGFLAAPGDEMQKGMDLYAKTAQGPLAGRRRHRHHQARRHAAAPRSASVWRRN